MIPIPSMYCPYENTDNFSRTSQIHFCFKNTLKNGIQTNGETPQTFLPLGYVDTHLIYSSLSRPHSPSQTTIRSPYALLYM